MIHFRYPSLDDRAWMNAIFAAADERGCEYNFTNLYTWSHAYNQQVARLDGRLLVRFQGEQGPCYLWPVGTGEDLPALRALEADASERGEPFCLGGLTNAHTARLEALFPGQFSFEPDRPNFDYLYEVDRLADLPGKKLHAKRNHINRFLDQNPTWSYEPLTRDSLAECLEMDREWERQSRVREGLEESQDLTHEAAALHAAASAFEILEMEGGVLRVFGEVVAFTMGDRLSGDTYDVHFEKAYGELQGAYTMINRMFSTWVREHHPEIRYLNREGDMGLEGLRKAKESYYPDLLLEKYYAVRR